MFVALLVEYLDVVILMLLVVVMVALVVVVYRSVGGIV